MQLFCACFGAPGPNAKAIGTDADEDNSAGIDEGEIFGFPEDGTDCPNGAGLAVSGADGFALGPGPYLQVDPTFQQHHRGGFLHNPACGGMYYNKYDIGEYNTRATGNSLSSFALSTIFEDMPEDGNSMTCMAPSYPQDLYGYPLLTSQFRSPTLAGNEGATPGSANATNSYMNTAYEGTPANLGPLNMTGFNCGSATDGVDSPLAVDDDTGLTAGPNGFNGHNGNGYVGGPGSRGTSNGYAGGVGPNMYSSTACGPSAGGVRQGELLLLGSGGGVGPFGGVGNVGGDPRMFTIISSSHLSTVFEEEVGEGQCGSCHSVGEGCCGDACNFGPAPMATDLLRGLSAPDAVNPSGSCSTSNVSGTINGASSSRGVEVAGTQYGIRRAQTPPGAHKIGGGSLAVWYV